MSKRKIYIRQNKRKFKIGQIWQSKRQQLYYISDIIERQYDTDEVYVEVCVMYKSKVIKILRPYTYLSKYFLERKYELIAYVSK